MKRFSSVEQVTARIIGEGYFIYTAFAPMQCNQREKSKRITAEHVLVKVGMSSVPFNRIINVHLNSPFRVAMAAFAPAGTKYRAMEIEERILTSFKDYRTRGEWLMLPNTDEMKALFSAQTRQVLEASIRRKVEWRRVTAKEIGEAVMQKLKKPS